MNFKNKNSRNKYRNSLSRIRRRGRNRNKTINRNSNRVVKLSQEGRFAPDRMFLDLVYNDTTLTRTAISSSAINWGYRSSAFDPDPAVLTGAIPGFAEISNLYTMYRVHSMKLEITVGNQELENIFLAVWPSNVLQNVNSLSSTDIMEYGANLRGKTMIVGPVTGSSTKSTSTVAKAISLVGPQYKTDLDYASSVSTNPVQMFYLNIGLVNPINNFNYPVTTRVKIIYKIEFFRLRQLET